MHVNIISTLKMAVIAALFVLYNSVLAEPFPLEAVEQPKERLPAPGFSLERLSDAKQSSLSDYHGKVVLLNFWATWCSPCREEMPAMQQAWERYRTEGFEVVAVAADRRGRKNVAPFIEEHGYEYPILLDPGGEVRNRYEVVGLPMSYLIGRDGKISGRVIGIIDWESPEAQQIIEQLLGQKVGT